MLLGFDQREKFVLPVQAGEDIPRPPVEESFLPDVDVEEAQGWSKRKFPENASQQPLAFDPFVLERTSLVLTRAFHDRLPV